LHTRAAKFVEALADGDLILRNRRPSLRRAALTLLIIFCHAPAVVFNTACVKLPRRAQAATLTAPTTQPASRSAETAPLININRASREELARLPGIGDGLAARIVEHRERYGAFRRTEHLLLVRGISERRFEQLRDRVTVE
jgi:competence ComEA-like helix-hairpin-helix protein